MHLTPSLRKLKLQVLMLFIRQSVLTLRGADSRQASAILWSTRWALSTCTSSEDILSGYKYTYSAVILWLNKNIQIYPAVMEIGHQNYQFRWKFLKSVTKKNCSRKYADAFFCVSLFSSMAPTAPQLTELCLLMEKSEVWWIKKKY